MRTIANNQRYRISFADQEFIEVLTALKRKHESAKINPNLVADPEQEDTEETRERTHSETGVWSKLKTIYKKRANKRKRKRSSKTSSETISSITHSSDQELMDLRESSMPFEDHERIINKCIINY